MNKKNIVETTKGVFDIDGQCWTDRDFSHPERTIRIATSFSGIGAPEAALERLGLKSQIVFACDIGERYLKYNFKQLKEFIKDFNEEDKEAFALSLYEENKAGVESTRQIIARHKVMKETGKEVSIRDVDYEPITLDDVRENLLGDKPKLDDKLELTIDCIRIICRNKGITNSEDIAAYVSSLYDQKGMNWQKESFFANHKIEESAWHTDIRFLDATKYRGLVDIYIGGSPCPSYSRSGKRLGLDDMRGTLFYEFAKRIEECQPKIFIFENVKGMMDEKDDIKSGLEAAIEVFQSLGYAIYWQVLNAKDYGIPQNRERVWVIGFRDNVDFKYPAPIHLTTRMYDYLDDDILPRSGNVDTPFVRHLTGTECLRLMGFKDFKIAPKLMELESPLKRDRILCQQAGNSMVVDCLMALFRQMDITQYGVELEKETTMEENKYLDNSVLESMSVAELSDLMVQVSTILNKKLHITPELDIKEEKNTIEETATLTVSEPRQVKHEIVSCDDDKAGIWNIQEIDLMNVDTDEDKPTETFKVNILDEIDLSGAPVKKIIKVGAEVSQKVKEEIDKIREVWLEAGGDVMEYYEKTRKKHDSQWNRVLSPNGICSTITKTEPPFILVGNEVPTNTDPVEIEIELDRDKPTDTPEPLW